MRSPIFQHQKLNRTELDEGLIAYQCPKSDGLYIKLEDYWRWHPSAPAGDDLAEAGEDEWYKAAYHQNDGVTANYWDYATGSDSIPTAVASGTTVGTAVYDQSFCQFAVLGG